MFVVGGGNYIEYQNLQDYCRRLQNTRRVTYGTSELMNAKQFITQVGSFLLPLFLSLSFSHSLSLTLFLSLSFPHSLSLTLFLSLSFSPSLSLPLFLSLSLTLFPFSPFLSLSPSITLTHLGGPYFSAQLAELGRSGE